MEVACAIPAQAHCPETVSNASDAAKRARLLEAAKTVFARSGFRRASMADIAAEAGVSRPALYLWFRSKEDVRRSLSAQMRTDVTASLEASWSPESSFAANVETMLMAREAWSFALGSAAADILGSEERRDLDRKLRAGLAACIRAAAEAGAIDPGALRDGADELADFLAHTASALARGSDDEDVFRLNIGRLARLAAAALRAA